MVILNNVARAIDRFSWTVTLIQRGPGSYIDGIYVESAPTSSSIKAAIQPASGNQLMDVPEGIRTEAGWLCWSRSAMAVDNTILHKGVTYRVLYDWPRDEGGFYRVALGRSMK